MPTHEPPTRFSQAFARRPSVARRGLLPGRRVFTSLGWAATTVLLVTLSVWLAGTVLPRDDGTRQAAAAAPTPSDSPSPAAKKKPAPKPERKPSDKPSTPEPPTPRLLQPQPKPEREPEPDPKPKPERTQETKDTKKKSPVQSGEVYRLHSGPGGCLDMGAGNADGDNVQQWACNDTPAQTFTIRAHGPDTYTLRNKGLCLDVADASPTANANVQMANCSGVAAQDWQIEPLKHGWYQLVAAGSGHCLDVVNGRTESGTNVIQWHCTDGPPQRWRLERV